MHVGIVHNTGDGALSVSKISAEYDPETGKQEEEISENEFVVVDIYPEVIKGRLEKIIKGQYEDCDKAAMATRVYLENPLHPVLGRMYKEGDLLCLRHNLKTKKDHHHDHDHEEKHSNMHKGDDIDKLCDGDMLGPDFVGGLLGNLHDLKQLD